MEFGALIAKLRGLEVRESKRGCNLGIGVGSGWSSKSKGYVLTPFDLGRGGLLNATEGTIGGVGLPPHSLLGALVSPGDSRLVVNEFTTAPRHHGTLVDVSRGTGWVESRSLLGHTCCVSSYESQLVMV